MIIRIAPKIHISGNIGGTLLKALEKAVNAEPEIDKHDIDQRESSSCAVEAVFNYVTCLRVTSSCFLALLVHKAINTHYKKYYYGESKKNLNDVDNQENQGCDFVEFYGTKHQAYTR